MLVRHQIAPDPEHHVSFLRQQTRPYMAQIFPPGHVFYRRSLDRFVAGGDLFNHQFDGTTIASHYETLGVTLHPANTNRVQGWTGIHQRLGDPDAGIQPSLFIHRRCTRLLDTLPFLQHDPDQPADVLKTKPNEEGLGGDDAADALRYLVATESRNCSVRKLTGW
jgi:hypothetical protein